MKKIVLAALVFSIASCNCQKSAMGLHKKTAVSVLNGCPEKNLCNYTVEENKSIFVKTDEGNLTYTLQESNNKKVILFEYSKPGPEGTRDGNYREEIIFEIDKTEEDFVLAGRQFQSSNMVFGVFCYCKGKAGYYRVFGGTIVKKGNELTVTLPNVVDNQKTTSLKIKI